MSGPVFARGDGVTLHPVEEDDLPFLQELINHPDVRRGIAATEPTSMADEREWFESDDNDGFLVCADGERVDSVRYGLFAEDWEGSER